MPSRSTPSWISAFENGPSTQPTFIYHPQRKLLEVQYARRVACIRDRVVQMAAVLVIGPIFEVDLLPQQHGFRPGLDAKMALRRVYWHVTQHGRREVVDADLRDYFNSIPHAPLMRSLSRRIADGRLLHVIKRWLTAPVVEVIDGRSVQTAEARRTKRGTPQGGVISPLLANCYFRRFLLERNPFRLCRRRGVQRAHTRRSRSSSRIRPA